MTDADAAAATENAKALEKELEKKQLESPTVTEEQAARAADGLAGLEELAMLDNGAGKKLEELERNMMFRQFYFPGGEAVKRLPGKGTDKKGEYKYDQIPGERYMMDDWDPRYLDPYITQARQNGFHKHFLYYDGIEVKPASFADAEQILMYSIKGDNIEGDKELPAYGIIAGLEYMGKLDLFVKEYGSNIGKTSYDLLDLAKRGDQVYKRAVSALEKLTGQSKADFVKKDRGWYSQDLKFAFDVAQYAAEWHAQQAKYKEYKDRIWEILKNVKNLNLCTNKTSGINIGNVSIQQMMDCKQTIQNNAAAQANATKQASIPVAPKKAEIPKAEPKPEPKPEPAPVVVPQPATPATPPTPPTPVSTGPNYMLIIIIAVAVIVIAGVGAFMLIRMNKQRTAVIQMGRM